MKIFGKVQDTNNEILPFANVTIASGSQANKVGVQTDLDGGFTLETPDVTANTLITVSYLGYVPQTFKASELQGKTVKLEQDIFALEEVVVGGTKPTTVAAGSGTKPTSKSDESRKITKAKFTAHLQKHRYAYAGIGALAGILLIAKSLKQ